MNPGSPKRSSGTIPVGYAWGRNNERRGVMWVPWDKGSVLNKGDRSFVNPEGIHAEAEKVDIPEEVIEAKRASLPPIRRRNQRQRAQELATMLFRDGLASQRMFGKPVWPRSVQRDIDHLGVGDKDIYEQVDALVTHYMIQTENQSKEADARRVTRGWHGHYD